MVQWGNTHRHHTVHLTPKAQSSFPGFAFNPSLHTCVWLGVCWPSTVKRSLHTSHLCLLHMHAFSMRFRLPAFPEMVFPVMVCGPQALQCKVCWLSMESLVVSVCMSVWLSPAPGLHHCTVPPGSSWSYSSVFSCLPFHKRFLVFEFSFWLTQWKLRDTLSSLQKTLTNLWVFFEFVIDAQLWEIENSNSYLEDSVQHFVWDIRQGCIQCYKPMKMFCLAQ